jgi:hypothetical protein
MVSFHSISKVIDWYLDVDNDDTIDDALDDEDDDQSG